MNKKKSLEGGIANKNENDISNENNNISLNETSLNNSLFKKESDLLPQSLIRKSYSNSNHKCNSNKCISICIRFKRFDSI